MKTLLEAIRPTTFISSVPLSNLLGAEVTIVSETFQHTGSFKFRAAYNLALSVPNNHIITASSGNFGQALAFACRLLGKKCHVVMPENSAKVKIEGVKNYGATVDLIDTKQVSRSARVSQLMNDFPQAYRASAYDDLLVIEGNASLGAEIVACDDEFDVVVVPIGGGGLISGIIKAFCESGYKAEVCGAEPLLGNDAFRSLQKGEIVCNKQEPQTLADGARTISLGEHNWKIIKPNLKKIIEVADEKLKEAVQILFASANLKAEPTGALTVGALLEQRETFAGKRVACVVSGGNVDAEVYRNILAG